MTNRSKVNVLAGVVIGLALLFFSSVQARADELSFQGTDTGTFSASGSNVYQYLTYNASAFGPSTTSGGFASLNLGQFILQNVTATYTGNFTLDVTFTVPSGTSGSSFNATVQGQVTNGQGGAAIFSFNNNAPELVSFNNGTDYGSFDLQVNGTSVNPGSTQELTAFITNAREFPVTAPELPTFLLSAVGIAGLFLLKGRRLISA